MRLELGKTYTTAKGSVTIVEFDEDDQRLPFMGDNGIWYNNDGISADNKDGDKIIDHDLTERVEALELCVEALMEEREMFIEYSGIVENFIKQMFEV